jgi:hypothetical protein
MARPSRVEDGRLAASIVVSKPYRTSRGIAVDITATAPYALYQEAGTRRGVRGKHYLRGAGR